ncbi:MAG: fibronectin type III domain-containing protein [Proteobacteria bacterium]|nr:fibronectin type III domain-containing protein [Pseudomonadota bacterium]
MLNSTSKFTAQTPVKMIIDSFLFLSLLLSAMCLVSEAVYASELLQFTTGGHVLGFSDSGVVVAGGNHAVKVDFVGAAKVLPTVNEGNTFSTETVRGVPILNRVTYDNLWDKITLKYDRTESGLVESTYHISPHGKQDSPIDLVRLRYNLPVSLDSSGNLVITYETGQMQESKPVAWQDIDGLRRPISVNFRILSSTEVGFALGNYDNRYALVIDPVLSWHTFLGSSAYDFASGITKDASGNLYVTGYSTATWGSPLNAYAGGYDAFVAKLNSSGALQWNTFLGSANTDYGYDITADTSGNLYITGSSWGAWGAPLNAHAGSAEGFVAKLNSSGVLQWNTFLGSAQPDSAYAITTDTIGNIYITGSSYAWGSPLNAHAGDSDVFVAKLNSSGVLQWHTFLGSANLDYTRGIITDTSGNLYILGQSDATWGSPLNAHAGSEDAFVSKLNSSGVLQWHTFLGSANADRAQGITADISGNLYITGFSPATWGSPLNAHAGSEDAFVAKLNNSGVLQWHTFLGSASADRGFEITSDSSGNLYITGYSTATWGSPLNAHAGSEDVFVASLNSAGALQWHTFLGSSSADGGIDITADTSGNLYITGYSPATWGSPLNAHSGSEDAFVAKLYVDTSPGLSTGLVAYYPLECDASDQSGNGNDGTIMNTPTCQAGVNGSALHFVGRSHTGADGDHVLLPDMGVASMSEMSMCLWVNEEGMAATSWGGESYIVFGSVPSGRAGIWHEGNDVELAETSIGLAVGNGNVTGELALQVPFYKATDRNAWKFYCMSYDGTTLDAYMDGQLVDSAPKTLHIASNNAALARHWWSGSSTSTRFTGLMDEVRIYNRPLSSTEIHDLYIQDAPGGDTDGDGIFDTQDPDDDNDGVADALDTNSTNPTICGDTDNDTCDDCSVQVDGFGPLVDSIPNDDGLDSDSDGICDAGDLCASDPAKTNPGICGCGTPDTGDSDVDGVLDCIDACPGFDDNQDADGDSIPDGCDTWDVTPSAGAGGSISPAVIQPIIYGETASFTIIPDTDYSIDAVTGCGGNLVGSIYTTGPITGACQVKASFYLTALPWSLSGTIFGGSNPAPGAAVDLIDTVSFDNIGTTVTDGNGWYSFAVSNGAYKLIVNANGYEESVVNNIGISGSDVLQDVVLIAPPTQISTTISGVVYSFEGVAVDGIDIQLYDGNVTTWHGTTDINGEYSITVNTNSIKNLAFSLHSGTTSAAVVLPDSFYKSYSKFPPFVTDGTDEVRNITLPEVVNICGKSTDSNGAAVGDVRLSFATTTVDGFYNYISTFTLADGSFCKDVFADVDYRVNLTPPAGSTEYTSTNYTNVDFSTSQTRDFVLDDAMVFTSTISGVVLSFEGVPLDGIDIELSDGDVTTWHGTTDSNGEYSITVSTDTPQNLTFSLNSGTTTAAVILPDSFYKSWNHFPSFVADGNDEVRNITLPEVVNVCGNTTDSGGGAVGDVRLGLFATTPDGFYNNISTYTLADGSFCKNVFADIDYQVILTPPAGSTEYTSTNYTNVDISTSRTIDFVLDYATIITTTISGIIRSFEGIALDGIDISLYDGDVTTWHSVTDINGEYSITVSTGTPQNLRFSLHSGTTTAAVVLPDSFYKSWNNFPTFVAGGTDEVRNITLPEVVAVCGGTTDSNGVAVGGVRLGFVTTTVDYFYSYISTFALADGSFCKDVFADIDYSISVTAPAGSGFGSGNVSPVDISNPKLINFILTMPDNVSPTIISGPTITSISDTMAVVEWQTNEKTSGEVRYGLNDPPSSIITVPAPATMHSQVLTGLTPDTDYFVQVTGSDIDGNGPVVSVVVSFHTKPTPDTKAPVITEGLIIKEIGHNSAVVEWETDEPSIGTLYYGITEGLGSFVGGSLSTEHGVTLTDLNPNTLYYIQVSSVDNIGNGPSLSPILSFYTEVVPDNIPPEIIEGPMILNISDTGATVFWTTDEPATSGVSYNDGTAYGVYQDDALVTEHTVSLTDLTASTTYQLTISSKDGQNNGPTLAGPKSFTTLASPDTNPPVIIESPLVVNITHQSVMIRWRTDEPANGVIEYGLAFDQLTETEGHVKLKKPHNMTITGLEAGTEYFFRVLSTDASGNGPVISAVYSFTTHPLPKSKKPKLIKHPEIGHSDDDDQVTIIWETDEPTDTVLEYNEPGESPKRCSKGEKVKKHQVTVKGLKSDTDYEIAVEATDIDGDRTHAKLGDNFVLIAFVGDAGVFVPQTTVRTSATPDLAAPVITSSPIVVGLSDTAAAIKWETDEISDSLIRYGLSGGSLNLQSGDIVDVGVHTIVLTNLMANTTYDYTVESIDTADNGPTVSTTYSFTTLAVPDTTDPVITTAPVATFLNESFATIEWTTDEAATTTINFGTVSGSLTQQDSIIGVSLDHVLTLTGLSSGTIYNYEVVSTDISGNTVTSSEYIFTTTGVAPGDFDGDGVLDTSDAFPDDPAASVDTDGDGYPDEWNTGKTQDDSLTGLTLDACSDILPIRLGGSYYWEGGLQTVYDVSMISSGTIKAHSYFVNGPLLLDKEDIDVTIEGGYNCDYSDNSGAPTVIESLTIVPPSGTVTIDNIVIQ